MTIKDQILQRLEEARSSSDPLDGEYKARIKKITQLKWDPAKAVYEKPGKPEREGASTTISGDINGKYVTFAFYHPEIVSGRLISGWTFVALYEGMNPKAQFNKSGEKIANAVGSGAPIKMMSAWKAIPEADRRANLKELDDAIRKYI